MLSILVLTYVVTDELAEYTKKCITSLKGQGDEIVVVDSGSTIHVDYPGCKVIRIKKNIGFIRAINKGMNACKGDYVVFVSNDTEVVEGKLMDMICDGLSFPKVNWTPKDYQADEWHGGFYGFPNKKFFRHSRDYTYYYTDTDLFERAKRKGIPFYRIDSVVINHRVNRTTSTLHAREKYYAKDKEVFRRKYGYASD
jgi:glycosyltransferase involved in cell wall biosynthesis